MKQKTVSKQADNMLFHLFWITRLVWIVIAAAIVFVAVF